MGKWTDQGFVANSLDHYKDRLNRIFIEAFGQDFLIDDTLPQGILITRLAELFYNMDMDGVEAFSRLNPNTCSGVYLDIVGALRQVPRGQGTPQSVTVQIRCNKSNFSLFTIPTGHIFTSMDGTQQFTVATGKTITSTESTLELEYVGTGNSNLTVGNKLQTTGFSQIEDIEVSYLTDGVGRESDLDYRRRLREVAPTASNTIEYVCGLISALQYVKAVGVNYNDTAEEADTLPPYTTEWMAVPVKGTDMDLFKDKIAGIIINNKTPGAPTAGNTEVSVADVFNQTKTVKFTIPTEVKLEIYARVATPEATGYIDLGNVGSIKQTIATYVNGLGIGDDVSYSRCLAPLAADTNFDVVVFRIRKLPDGQPFEQGKEYHTGDVIWYESAFYKCTGDTQDPPSISGNWELDEDGWVDNQNFSIGSREYASIDTQYINVGI